MPCTEEVRVISEHFVKHIYIKGYKCFSDFSAKGLGRVNLISGKNNVGKTAFMEAVLINLNAKDSKVIIATFDTLNILRTKIDQIVNAEDSLINLEKNLDALEIKTNINTVISNIDRSQILLNFDVNLNGNNSRITETEVLEFFKSRTAFRMEAAYIGSISRANA